MKTVFVNAPSKKYEVCIEAGLLERVGELAARVRAPGKAVVITDSNVDPLYGERLCCSLRDEGYTPQKLVIPAGEGSKNAYMLISALEFIAGTRMTRAGTVFALGGGVVGDLAGLAASLYMRGVGLVQIPTTLLAAVDSSVGGKTAINLENAKNLAGAFYQPDLVICDTDTLATLEPREVANGCAEVIKYGFIRDAALLDTAEKNFENSLPAIIERCVEIKRDIVCRDEHDTGERQLLNFGHTFGHAIEKVSGYSIPHGYAVACGMAVITSACVKKGICKPEVLARLLAMLEKFNLPSSTSYTASALFDSVLSDKKRMSDRFTVVVPKKTGRCELLNLSLSEVRELLLLGTEET